MKNKKLDKDYIKDKAPLFKRLFGSNLGLLMYIAFVIKKINQIDNYQYCIIEGIKVYRQFKI